jgi:hypothetical protein
LQITKKAGSRQNDFLPNTLTIGPGKSLYSMTALFRQPASAESVLESPQQNIRIVHMHMRMVMDIMAA